jgi:hypothetical protein
MFALTFVQACRRRSSGPDPIRPASPATFPSKELGKDSPGASASAARRCPSPQPSPADPADGEKGRDDSPENPLQPLGKIESALEVAAPADRRRPVECGPGGRGDRDERRALPRPLDRRALPATMSRKPLWSGARRTFTAATAARLDGVLRNPTQRFEMARFGLGFGRACPGRPHPVSGKSAGSQFRM